MRKWSNRTLVRERDERVVRWLWRTVLAIVIAVAPSGAYLYQQNECLELSYEVNRMHEEHQTLLERERKLKVELAELSTLARIEERAHREHGLERPDADRIIVLSEASTTPDDLIASARQVRRRR